MGVAALPCPVRQVASCGRRHKSVPTFAERVPLRYSEVFTSLESESEWTTDQLFCIAVLRELFVQGVGMRAVCAESNIQKTVELPQMPFDDDAVDVPVATWRRVVTSSRNWRGSRRESTTNLDSPLSTGCAFELIASRARTSEQQCCAEIVVVHVAAHSRQMFSHHPWVRSGFVQVESRHVRVRSLMQAGDREISHDGGVMVVAPLPEFYSWYWR